MFVFKSINYLRVAVARRSNFIISQPFILLVNKIISKNEDAVAKAVFY
ncbi:hypothetical protein GP2143_11734 [marine gamma proteobacterium HTCC2143]|uniref:Uncharacterized protein n=1 Tax=marine gamma proteobacterium HTCC2143 TaxID=247633 RepID=A0YGZ3_9GAMM|nr:hypothetical protein GP2143_11734 [marine gamma proteobacterium HTCC2143]